MAEFIGFLTGSVTFVLCVIGTIWLISRRSELELPVFMATSFGTGIATVSAYSIAVTIAEAVL